MTTKLTAITPTYRTFEDDQVLTSGQLNEFLNYFDDQDRLSRICLTGVGVVCGFKVDFTQSSQLELTQGCGITTDGDLLHLQESLPDGLKDINIQNLLYTHFRIYQDDKAKYKPFFDNGVQFDLWELLTEQVNNELPISAIPDLTNKVVLIYLESYAEDPDVCVGVSCDNLGINQVQNIRILLVSEKDARQILTSDSIYDANSLLSTYMNLNEVAVPRVVMNSINTASFAELNNSYRQALKQGNVVTLMTKSIEAMLEKIGKKKDADEIRKKLETVFGPTAPQPTLFFQYYYDLLKDLVDTYNEMKEMFLSCHGECIPDIYAFQKHLMLGKLIPTQEDTLYKRYRHAFYKSSALSCCEEGAGEFDSLVERMKQQLNDFVKSSVYRSDAKSIAASAFRGEREIKIIPSRYGDLLGNKAIPFYYNLQEPLLKAWNYDKTKHNKQRRNLSYHTAILDPSDMIQNPLRYNLEPYNFFNIEGLQGYDYREAMKRISDLKINNGLSFDLKALGITISPNETINMDDYACEFEDLKVLLDSTRKEHECLLGNASYYLSSYSLVKQGDNLRQNEFLNPMKATLPLSSIPLNRTPGKTGNAVQDNLLAEKDTMGRVLLESVRANTGCSAADIIGSVNRELTKYDFKTWDPVEFDITINKPMEILAYSYMLLDKLPVSLPAITRPIINEYSINAGNVCSLAKKVQAVSSGEIAPAPSNTRSITEAVAVKGDFSVDYSLDYKVGGGDVVITKEPSMVKLLMNQLASVCCSTKKLENILEEIEKRKERILLNLKLSKFIEKHPGIEHLRGTKPGGTFLMVYVTDTVSGIPSNTVVADFSLPYLCCSDCTSVNFIMPRPVASLQLSSDRFCIGNDKGPLQFKADPANGIIKADRVVPGMSINGTQLLINPSLIPDSVIGVPVYFTLNDQVTGTSLTFYRSPKADFAVPKSPTTDTLITFSPKGLFDAKTKFEWDFGDGSSAKTRVAAHQFKLPVNDENRTVVTLTVTPADGACPTIVSHEIEFLKYEVSLEPETFCSVDNFVYPFKITPKEAKLNIEGKGVEQISEYEFGFNPYKAGSGNITIFINDEPWKTVTVNPSPQANIIAKIEKDILALSSNMYNTTSFYWTFEDIKGEQVHAPIEKDPNPGIPLREFSIREGKLIVKLHVVNDCDEEVSEVAVTLPQDIKLCSLEMTKTLNEGVKTLETLMGSSEYKDDLTEEQKRLFGNTRELFRKVLDNLQDVTSGEMNAELAKQLSSLIYELQSEIVSVFFDGTLSQEKKEVIISILLEGYSSNAYLLFPSVIRCQEESAVKKGRFEELFDLIRRHLDPENSDSFESLKIKVDPNNIYKQIMISVMQARKPGSYSWSEIISILVLMGAM